MRSGFSLLELSIVLVIIGLLAGGVMTGQSLIRAAEMRVVSTEYGRFATAFNAFRDKYQAAPGDFKTATAFWGKDNTNCTADSGTTATPGTCNGNGNGQIELGTGASATGEAFRLWQHLALGGLIEGTYSGLAGTIGNNDFVLGANAPASKVTNAGWGARTLGYYAGDLTWPAGDYSNFLSFGATTPGNMPLGAILKPEEAWNVDSKLDDGKPETGKIVAMYWGTGGGASNRCTNGTAANDTAATYNLTNAGNQCALLFLRAL